MWYYVYVLIDIQTKLCYIGYTEDLNQRLKDHRSGKTMTTAKMVKPELIYYEACLNKKDALIREKQLKTGFGRGYIKKRIENYLSARSSAG